jgi:two-component system sensor histidine kinase/response regulator
MSFNNLKIDIGDGYILAAEDSMVQAKRITYFFESINVKYKICKNGIEALEYAKKHKPTLLISDIVMPLMDGYELCLNIKEDPELADIPVILLTSLSDPLDIIKGLQAGADNFITKPYEDEYLKMRINYLLMNRTIRKTHGFGDMSIDIMFQGKKFIINSDKKQILDLLLSVYEAAINRNEQLIEAQRQMQILNENLKSANMELEAFARTVSHDLRAPLNNINGFTDILSETLQEMNQEEPLEYLGYIKESTKNMNQLIQDLLYYSRSGRSELNPELVNLSEMSMSIIEELRKTNYTAAYSIHVEEDIEAKVDKKLIHIAMTNLISNALKYSQKAESPRIHIGSRVINHKKVYFIRDNGAGFDTNKADNLFKPFIRMHSDDEFQGTGVGLSTVKRVVERHGGSIWYESVVGKGTIFYFTLQK